jgi:hypothetical protein
MRDPARRSHRHAIGDASVLLRAMTGGYLPHGNVADADCVVAFSFGFRLGEGAVVEPGPINSYLATIIESERGRRPVIAQFEIADALQRQTQHQPYARIGSQSDHYLDTRAVAEKAAAVMRSAGWRCAMVVAHPNHLSRADATMKATGVDTVVRPGIKPLWDPESEQVWTRNPFVWVPREVLAIAHYAAKGWLLPPPRRRMGREA